ncbi:prephenate dehydratase domain-containing protein [Endozoicomonas atrinae]
MCLLRTAEATAENIPLRKISSHPAALAQITGWKDKKNLIEIEDPAGTSEAARKLATNLLSNDTGAIGSAFLATLYPDLVIAEEQIQDSKDNTTLFGQLTVSRRESPVSDADARRELEATIEIAEHHLGGAFSCFI